MGSGTVSDMTWKQVVDAYSCTECGRCQDACPAWATGKDLSPKLLIMGLRDHLFAEGPGRRRPRGRRAADSPPLVPGGGHRRGRVGLRHLRRLRAGVPGVDRARRPHRRHAPPPRHGRGALPGRGRADAARRRALVNPWGKAAGRARRVGRGPGRARAASRAIRRRRCSTGSAARPRSTSVPRRRPVDREADAGGRRRLRHPRPARDLHRRPRPADGQRVRLPGLRRAERRDAEQGRRAQDRDRVPALLQHPLQRVPRLRRQLRGGAPLRAPGRARPRRPDRARRRRGARHLPRLLLPGPPQRHAGRRRASWSPRSASRSRWRKPASARSAAARAARTCGWRSAAGGINEERVRQAAETGAETLAVACPYCTIMLDDGVRTSGRDLRVADVATLLAESVRRGSPSPIGVMHWH